MKQEILSRGPLATAIAHLWLRSIGYCARTLAVMIATFALVVLTFGFAAAPAEPTEQDMRDAVQARVDGLNATLRSYELRCTPEEMRGNAVLAMICTVFVAPNRGQVLAIERLEKQRCEVAAEAPGYRCEYILRLSSNKPVFTGRFGVHPNGSASGRFAYQDGRWVQTIK